MAVNHPQIPYAADIPGGLSAGCAILIRGIVKDGDPRRFNVDLCCGRLVQGDHRDDVALHINPRFDQKALSLFGKPDNNIVMNSLLNNVWGMEHRAENTLYVEKNFSLRILVLKDYYKITLNGKLLADFVHRIAVERVKTIFIGGAVQIERIEFQGSSTTSTPTTPEDEEFEQKVFQRPSVPFVQDMAGFLSPRQIRVTGTPRMNGTRFSINFMADTEYLFHFRVDIPTASVPQGFVVRNSTEEGKWLTEERDVPFFAFKVGHTVDIVFLSRKDFCEVVVNGRVLCIFRLRNGSNWKNVTSFTINGDIILQSVHFL